MDLVDDMVLPVNDLLGLLEIRWSISDLSANRSGECKDSHGSHEWDVNTTLVLSTLDFSFSSRLALRFEYEPLASSRAHRLDKAQRFLYPVHYVRLPRSP